MAITKGKKTRRKTVLRRSGKSHLPSAKVSSKRAARGDGAHSVQIPEERRGVQRAGRHTSGSWDTQKWLIGKKLAHVVKEKLIADFRKGDARELEQKIRKQRVRR